MDNEFEVLLRHIQAHFSVAELVEFLGIEFHQLLNQEEVLDIIEEHMEELKQEIGYNDE